MLNNAIALIAVAALFGVEAIKVKERLPRIIFAAIAVVFALWAVLVEQIAAAWPKVGAFVTATFEQPVSWFVLAIALFFVVRPYWRRPAKRGYDLADLPVLDHAKSDELLERVLGLEGLLAGNQAALKSTVATMADLQKLLSGALDGLKEIRQEFAEHKEHMSERYTAQDAARITTAEALNEKVNGHINSIDGDIGFLKREDERLQEIVDRNEKYLRESLSAIWSQGRLNELAGEIEQHAAAMYDRFADGEVYMALEWDQWTNVEHLWERKLKEWIDTARWYAKDVKKRVLTVEDKEYDGDWKVRDNQFPTADAVRRFKRHRIIQRHWCDVREEVAKGVVLVAFIGQTEREQHGGKFHNP